MARKDLSKDPANLLAMWKKAKRFYYELKKTGLSDTVIAAILGNIAQESSFNPKARAGSYSGYIQNQKEIVNWVIKNFGGYDHIHLMNYLIAGLTLKLPDKVSLWGKELNTRFNTFLQGLTNNITVALATKLWETSYEKSGGQALQQRINYANYFYNQILAGNKTHKVKLKNKNTALQIPEITYPLENPEFSEPQQNYIAQTNNAYNSLPLSFDFKNYLTPEVYGPQSAEYVKSEFDLPLLATNFKKGGKLIKKGQQGMKVVRTGPYSTEIYLEKDGNEPESPHSELKSWIVGITPEERMDQTVQELASRIDPFTNKLIRPSTYLPTLELRQAGAGIKHPISWTDYVAGLAPLAIPAIVSSPYWAPAAATTLTSPTFWTGVATKTIPNLIKDTALYTAADAASEATTNRGLGANINRLFDLEDNHPVGDFIGFGGTSFLRRPLEKGITSAYKGLRGAIYPEYALSLAMNETLWKPYVSRVIGENNKIRLRLPNHTDQMPREVVIDPLGNNKFYVHIRTWNDIDGKVPANLTPEEIGYLYEALYDELPEGAEILFPKSGPGNYATRGTVAGLLRLARDPRFAPGDSGKLQYIDKDGNIKIFKGTSFFKRVNEQPEYIERLLIPFAQQQGNWNGKTDLVNNIGVRYTSGAPWAGMFNGKTIFINPSANTAADNLDEILIHEIRHAYDYAPKYDALSSDNWFIKIGSMSPFHYSRQKVPIELRKSQTELLKRAYPTKFKDRFRGPDYRTSEKIATNAELRKYMDRLYFLKFNKKPTVKELNNFIWNLSDEEFASELAKYGYNHSPYLHTYLQNIINNPLKIPGNVFKIKAKPGLNVNVNKSLINRQRLSLIRRALTSVPALVPPVMLLDDNNEN